MRYFSVLRFLIITFHVGDERPLHPRSVFVPPYSENVLPAEVDFSARHYFSLGLKDADQVDKDYTLHYCGEIDISLTPIRDVYPASSQEEHALFNCALDWYTQEQRLSKFDAVIFTHSQTFIDALTISKRFRYLLRRGPETWNLESRPDRAWGSSQFDFELVVPSERLITSPHYPIHGNSHMMHAGYDNGAIHRISEEELENGLGYKSWLDNMRIHCDLKHGMRVLHKATEIDPLLNMRTGSLLPRCIYPAAFIIVYSTEMEMRRAEHLRSTLRASFSCQHLVVMVDNGLENVESTYSDIRLHTHTTIAEARIAGLRMAQTIANEWGENPYIAVSFPDVARLKIDNEMCRRGWVTRLLEELFAIDKAVGIHPVLSADSDTSDKASGLRSFPFLRTSMRTASYAYRSALEPHECCQQVWILGGDVVTVWKTEWLAKYGWFDPLGGLPSMLELESAYHARQEMIKLLISEAALVKREQVSTINIAEEYRIAMRAAAARAATARANKIVARQQEIAIACLIMSDKFGRDEPWTESLFFGGSIEAEVDRLARAGGKSVLYKPSGAVLEVSFKTHQHPSINEVKAKWEKSCDDHLITRHTTTTAQVGDLLSEIRGRGKSGKVYSKSHKSRYFTETPDVDSHMAFLTLSAIVFVLAFFLVLWCHSIKLRSNRKRR